MGAISVTSEEDVWGASRSFIYNIVEFCISEVGEKPYLIYFKNQIDYGYNSFDIYTLSHADHSELIGILRKYSAGKFFVKSGDDPKKGENLLKDLIGRMEVAESERSQKN